jgi:hypothetical protein
MPQHVNAQSFVTGSPRAIIAGRKGGLNRKGCGWRSADYIKGYAAGARNARRHIQRWIQEQQQTVSPQNHYHATGFGYRNWEP